jgi:hypothetical protein
VKKPKRTQASLRLPEKLIESLDLIAEIQTSKTGKTVSRNDVMTGALMEYCKKCQEE